MLVARSLTRIAGLCLLGALITACGGSSEPAKTKPTLKPGGCGLSYDWLPAAQVGDVVSSSELVGSKKASTIDALLPAAGLGSLTPVPYGMRLFKLRYTTQDRGKSVEATGLVGVPWNNGEPPIQAPMLLALHGTSGVYGPCAPSAPENQQTSGLLLSILASQGYITVAPDFIGLDADADPNAPPDPVHAYLEAEQVAVGSLDMLRAAKKVLETLPDVAQPTDDVLLWGPSQGGHAAFAAELYAPYYAPEYDILGAVAAIPPTDMTGLGEYSLTHVGPTSAVVTVSMVAQDNYFSNGSHVADILTDTDPDHFATAVPKAMYSSCDGGGVFDNVTEVTQVFTPAAIATAKSGQLPEPFDCYAAHSSLATTPVKRISNTPFYFILGEKDDLVIPSIERKDFTRLCDQGYRMEYLECAGAGHIDAGKWSVPEQIRWFAARVDGKPLDSVCELAAATHCSAEN